MTRFNSSRFHRAAQPRRQQAASTNSSDAHGCSHGERSQLPRRANAFFVAEQEDLLEIGKDVRLPTGKTILVDTVAPIAAAAGEGKICTPSPARWCSPWRLR